jgi:prepilin-type N-terminal cleavage/methylation domain-containing protein
MNLLNQKGESMAAFCIISVNDVVDSAGGLSEAEISLNERVPKCDSKGGFTLIELLVVIAIIALLMAMQSLTPRYKLTKFIHSGITARDMNIGRGALWLSKEDREFAFINLRELPPEGLLMWAHLWHPMFPIVDRAVSQRALRMSTSRLSQERGVEKWYHEIITGVIQIPLANL